MKIEVEPPQTKSQSRGWLLLAKGRRYLYHYLVIIFTLIYQTFSTFTPTTASISSDVEPPSFSSLPDDIIVNCLARISRSYYPKLSLVSKTFRSLILSNDLARVRGHLNTQENVLFVCLQLHDRRRPSWFSLSRKPDQTLTNDFDLNNKSNGNTLLVPIPSSYSPRVPSIFRYKIGSKIYATSPFNAQTPSLVMWVCNEESNHVWHQAPRMRVTRENAVTGALDGKIYIMGGCNGAESTNWAEVFDTKTQTWESLPDPGPELRSSWIKEMNVDQGKIYVSSSAENDYVYDPKEDRWDVTRKAVFVKRWCTIKNVWYACDNKSIYLYDRKQNKWSNVKGLEEFISNCCGGIITLATNSGKLLILWDKIDDSQNKNKKILCSAIAFEERNNDEVWGKVEWTNVVLTVPSSYVFLRNHVIAV